MTEYSVISPFYQDQVNKMTVDSYMATNLRDEASVIISIFKSIKNLSLGALCFFSVDLILRNGGNFKVQFVSKKLKLTYAHYNFCIKTLLSKLVISFIIKK